MTALFPLSTAHRCATFSKLRINLLRVADGYTFISNFWNGSQGTNYPHLTKKMTQFYTRLKRQLLKISDTFYHSQYFNIMSAVLQINALQNMVIMSFPQPM